MTGEAPVPQRLLLTVLFADIVGSTSLSERLDAEDVAIVQQRYFDEVRATIDRYGGSVEKFMGDGVLAAFGLSRTREDDAERAVRAGLALVNAAERVGAVLGLDPPLRVRVGVNTGEVVHTPAAHEPLTGDTVNVASRLQTSAAPGEVIVGEATALAVESAIALEALGPLALKGKAAPAYAWRALTPRSEASRDHALGRLRAEIVGRDEELLAIAGLVRHARAGATVGTLIVAPPGVGKSRLMSEIVRAHDGTMSIQRARLRPDRSGPLDEVAQILRAALASGGVHEGPATLKDALMERAAAAGWSPARAETVASHVDAVLRPSGASVIDQEQLVAAALDAIDALTAPRPQLWIVEDVHWANPDVVSFLRAAAQWHAPHGRLVLLTARPAFLDAHAQGPWQVMTLSPLAGAAVTRLVHALVGDALPDPVVATIAARSDGNPLFVEELLRSWANVGLLAHDGASWRLLAEDREITVPTTVQAIYAAELDDLPAAARTATRRGSVAGRRFPAAALPALDVHEASDALSTLVRRAVVSGPEDRPVHGPLFTFRHALLRDAGYASLGRGERARAHVAYARWLESRVGDEAAAVAEEIAEHYVAARDAAPALRAEIVEGIDRADAAALAARWLELAAQECMRVAAHATAEERALRSVELTPGGPDHARRLLILGRAASAAGHLDRAADAFTRAMAEHRELIGAGTDARAGLVSAALGLGGVYEQQVLFHDMERLATDVLAEIGDADETLAARLRIQRATARVMLGVATEDDPDAAGALAVARERGDADLELQALEVAASIRLEIGAIRDDEARQIEALARERGRWEIAARWMRARATLLLDDDPRASLAVLGEAYELAEAKGLAVALGWVGYGRTEVHFLLGQDDEALRIGLATVESADRDRQVRIAVRTWYVLSIIAADRGDLSLLRRADEWHHAHRAYFPDSAYGRLMHAAFGLRVARAGLAPGFVPELDRVLDGFRQEHVTPSWLLATHEVFGSYLRAGAFEDAETLLGEMSHSNATRRGSLLGRATESLLRAELAVARGRPEEARGDAREALMTFERIPAWPFAALALRLPR